MSASRFNRVKVQLNQGNSTATLVMERRDSWGRLRERRQFTVPLRVLTRALTQAEVTVPWDEVLR